MIWLLLALLLPLAPFPPWPPACVGPNGTPYFLMRWTDDGTQRGVYTHLGCPGEPKALPVPGGDPVFVWTGPDTGTVAFYGPGLLTKHRGDRGRLTYETDEAGLFVLEVPPGAPADIMDRPYPGDTYCINGACVEVLPRGWLALPWVAG